MKISLMGPARPAWAVVLGLAALLVWERVLFRAHPRSFLAAVPYFAGYALIVWGMVRVLAGASVPTSAGTPPTPEGLIERHYRPGGRDGGVNS